MGDLTVVRNAILHSKAIIKSKEFGIVCFDSSWPPNSVNLALNFQLDAFETCHCVHVDANLPIYEVDVLLNYVVETLNHRRCCFPLRLYRTERQAEPVYLHVQSFNRRAS